tara:strand:- start:3305 stop:5494 length:2190 start_codon:yes stop_codon:yes gene_type:complete
MATPQLSPGVLVREVDLTVGRADNVIQNIGAIAGPFTIGPIDEPTTINTQQELINTFGQSIGTDRQYEYWMTASSFLTYGGVLSVVRTDGDTLNNANAGVGIASTTLKIKSKDDYELNYSTASNFYYATRNPGRWGTELKVCQIDNAADQIVGLGTTNPSAAGAIVGQGVTTPLSSVVIPGAGTTSSFDGYLQAIITGVTTDATDGRSSMFITITNRVSTAGTIFPITYAENDPARSFETSDTITFMNSSGISTGNGTVTTAGVVQDWYDQQTLGLQNSNVFWRSIAPRPVTNQYATTRNSKNDAINVAVVDDNGSVTGIQGNILETFASLSKGKDTKADADNPTVIYYKDFILQNSEYIFAGANGSSSADAFHGTSPRAAGFSTDFTPITTSRGVWGSNVQDVTFNSVGNISYTLGGGEDYQTGGGHAATLDNLKTSYELFSNKDEIDVDFMLMGPGLSNEVESQSKVNLLISLCEARKDCIATISPHRDNVVNVTNADTQTTNILRYYSPLSSSSFAIFDTGYKYIFDRFSNEFRYIPTNGDVAGLCVRTSLNSFPWFSPAGQRRGVLNDAIKLAYNPNKNQRDRLYGSRINSIITQRGSGTLLFGDKTGLGYASAFDRINVRRLFLTIERSLENAANAQLFEINDVNTRSNFVNIVEPFLRDIQSKRGLVDFLVVCNSQNNTPDVIDNNEFRADIFLKPTKSINYITLTFVATRTGVDFEELVGTV